MRASLLLSLTALACTPTFDVPESEDSGEAEVGGTPDPVTVALSINELMASNSSLALDPDDPDATPDWIEIYNASDVDVSLEGLFITDDLSQPLLHRLDDLTVPAGGFVVLLADDDPDAGPRHLPFKLSAEGDAVGLFDETGTPLDQLTFADLDGDQVAGRLPDGGDLELLDAPTPGETNGGGR